MNQAYVSFSGIWTDQLILPLQLKMITLLFDKVYFQDQHDTNFLNTLVHAYAGDESTSKATQGALQECWLGTPDWAPPFNPFGINDEWPWTSAPEGLRNATDSVMKEIAGNPEPSMQEQYEYYKWGGYLMSDILYWRAYFADATLVADPAAEKIVARTNPAAQGTRDDYPSISGQVPDILDVPWESIIELRKSSFLTNFRTKYSELSKQGKTHQLLDEYLNTLEKLADAVKPNRKTEIAKAS